jgi:phage head maturation protease
MRNAEILERRIAGAGNRIHFNSGQLSMLAQRITGSAHMAPALLTRAAKAAPVLAPMLRGVEDKARQATFVINTSAVDWCSDVVDPKGLDLSVYRSNPTVLWSHLGALLPVGRAVRTWKEPGRVLSTVQFAATKHGEEVRKLVAQGFLSAASIGFMPLTMDWSDDPARKFGLDIDTSTLVEWSICNTPCNPECLVVSRGEATTAAEQRIAEARAIRDGKPLPTNPNAKAAAQRIRAAATRAAVIERLRKGSSL